MINQQIKLLGFIEHFKNDGLEIVSREDMDDLKLLKATRNEDTISFDEYMKDEKFVKVLSKIDTQYKEKIHTKILELKNPQMSKIASDLAKASLNLSDL